MRSLRLADICSLITDGTHYTPPNVDSGVPFLTVKNINSQGALDFEGCSKITADEFAKAVAGNSAPTIGDVLFSKDGTVGKVSVVSDHTDFAVLSSIAILRPNFELVDSKYLGYALQSPDALDQALKKKTGSAIRRIILSDLKNVEIPLPPLPEQRRIAAILNKADALRSKRREAIAKLNQLLQSVFLEMFGDPVTNPKGWPIVALSIYGNVATGNTPPRSAPENYGPGIEWIKSDNLNTRHDYVTKAEEQLSDVGARSARVAPPGSVLVTCIAGSLSCIGNLAITDRRVAFNQQINAVTPQNSPPEFLYFLLKSAKPLIQDASTNGMKGMVNKSKFSAIQLPAPPIELQKEFSRSFLEIQKLRSLADAALERQETLFAALQQRAFEGKL